LAGKPGEAGREVEVESKGRGAVTPYIPPHLKILVGRNRREPSRDVVAGQANVAQLGMKRHNLRLALAESA